VTQWRAPQMMSLLYFIWNLPLNFVDEFCDEVDFVRRGLYVVSESFSFTKVKDNICYIINSIPSKELASHWHCLKNAHWM
jgi:hypothetical protein